MKIFLIEDDLALGSALLSVLQDDGHTVVWVRMATGACARIAAEQCDALLLDLGLPDGDGMGLLAALRADGQTLPVLIMTARDSLEDRLGGFQGGADDYLIKPFEIPELLARLRAIVRRVSAAGDAPKPVWRHGDLVLDERRVTLTQAGLPVNLSRTEFALLCALLKASDRVLTRAELESRVLPHSEGQSLDVHISNLRKKIGDGYIRTVRGVGYLVQDAPA
ncbi:response regulator transcription factor [Massilia glaciei]|uniref:DNA-binding response regulator n=1 Tax=Massilia glaciei TaxID=1524097 RepID=A0A2U2I4F4_9BURK|nr:response regulator transcription factor [Massilia glaciei]PWF54646.1 DNA-binding response regulator [Massilia glaciei]